MNAGQTLISECLQATGADVAMAERAAISAMEPDIIGLLISHQSAAFVRLGRTPMQARAEAIDAVAVFLEDASRRGSHDISIGTALAQSRAYRLRGRGLTVAIIADRLNESVATVKRHIKAEMMRIRSAA